MAAIEHTVRIEHRFPVPPHGVYRAWLDADLVRQWVAPGDLEVTRAQIDERPGGAWRIWLVDKGENAGGFDAELLELIPDQRLVLRWGFTGPKRREGQAFDTLLTISLRAEPPGTTLTLIHERLDELGAVMPEVAANVGPGWKAALAGLDKTLTAAG